MLRSFTISILLCLPFLSPGQCDPYFEKPLSQRLANYEIDVNLDHIQKTIQATQVLTWVNHSPDTLHTLRFYMYINAFKNTESTFVKSAQGEVFGSDITNRTANEWGWIEIDQIRVQNSNTPLKQQYVQPDDNNTDDQTVLEIELENFLLPSDTVTLDIDWSAQLPRIMARCGYGDFDFVLSSGLKAVIAIILVIIWILALTVIKNWIFFKKVRT